MPFPSSDVNLTNLDLGTDSPATARTDLYDLASKFNLLRNFIDTIGQAVISASTKAAARSAMDAAEVGANTTITSIKGVSINQGAGTTTGNIAIGPLALISNTTGTYNISIGDSAGYTNTTGVGNITIGAGAGQFSNGVNGAVYIGHNSGLNAKGINNTFVGGTTGVSNVAGHDNTFLGYNAGTANVTGNYVTAVGSYALASTTTGVNNTAVGYQALANLTTGANNVGVGSNAQASTPTTSNTVTLGNASIAVLRCAVTSITALSDQRDKKDIEDIPIGLAFVNTLRPVKFTWNSRDGSKVDIPDSGFIAQELKTAQDSVEATDWLKLVMEDDPEKLEASAGRLMPVLVKAIQELSATVNAQAARIEALEAA